MKPKQDWFDLYCIIITVRVKRKHEMGTEAKNRKRNHCNFISIRKYGFWMGKGRWYLESTLKDKGY
jgi:hypothetical protein